MTGDIKIRDSRQDSEDNSSWSGSSFDESERRSSTPHNQQNQPARQGTSSSRQASVSESQAGKPKQKRAFKACAHCRARKAKCDLGGLTDPKEPPCSRCKREGIECKFLPSRRAGRVPYEVQLKRKQEAAIAAGLDPALVETMPPPVRSNSGSNRSQKPQVGMSPPSAPQQQTSAPSYSFAPVPPASQQPAASSGYYYASPYIPYPQSYQIGRGGQSPSGSTATPNFSLPSLMPPAAPPIFPATMPQMPHSAVSGKQAFKESPPINSPDTVSDTKTTSSASSLTHPRKKRKRDSHAPIGPNALAAASLRNPVDALDLLVMAADGVPRDMSDEDDRVESAGGTGPTNPGTTPASAGKHPNGAGGDDGEARSDRSFDSKDTPAPTLADFPLVKNGVLTGNELVNYVELFFSRIHPSFPIIPSSRTPKGEAAIAKFAADELYLTAVFVVVASRFKDLKVHQQSWAFFQTLISEVMLGHHASVGAVEALLILSEYPPRKAENSVAQINSEENREAWMLVGAAVRLGYMLGLDQKTFLPSTAPPETGPMSDADEMFNRERLAWTYCYIFDRQISIRTGKAFWSRGPGLCFTGGAVGGLTATAERNFPSLRPIANEQEDFASLIQAYVELTQIMTSCHDVLYPSRLRTQTLIKLGEYWKYIDELHRSLDSFKATWIDKRWKTFPLTELCWITYHYLRLYIDGFAFQAHVQRAADDIARLGPDRRGGNAIFPGGVTASPDAKYILDAVDAACDLLRLVTDRLHPGGALPFLPQRFFMTFSYAGVFLLKAVFVEAVLEKDRQSVVRLVKRVIFVLVCASTDEQHCGQRYARLLNGLLRAFSKGQESFFATQAPSRATSPGVSANRNGQGNQTDNDLGLPFSFGTSMVDPPGSDDRLLNGPLYPPVFSALPNNANGAQASVSTPASMPFMFNSGGTPAHSAAQDAANNGNAAQMFNFDMPTSWDDPALMPAAPGVDAINFLLEDTALDFWQSFSANSVTPAAAPAQQ